MRFPQSNLKRLEILQKKHFNRTSAQGTRFGGWNCSLFKTTNMKEIRIFPTPQEVSQMPRFKEALEKFRTSEYYAESLDPQKDHFVGPEQAYRILGRISFAYMLLFRAIWNKCCGGEYGIYLSEAEEQIFQGGYIGDNKNHANPFNKN